MSFCDLPPILDKMLAVADNISDLNFSVGRPPQVEINGKLFRVRLYEEKDRKQGQPVRRKGGVTQRAAMGGGAVLAPMQGTIVKVLVEEGQEVAADQAVCLLEAMKMESEIRTQKAGRIKEVLVGVGKTVSSGEPLVVLE